MTPKRRASRQWFGRTLVAPSNAERMFFSATVFQLPILWFNFVALKNA